VEGIFDLFSKSILRIFRTLVYSKLSYLPNYLPVFNLWKLCVYAEPRLEKLEYLFEKLSGNDFFKEVNKRTLFHHDLSRLTEKKLLNAGNEERKTGMKGLEGWRHRGLNWNIFA